MGMSFTVSVKADFTVSKDADMLISRWDVDNDMLDFPGDVSIEDVGVNGEVEFSGRLSIDDLDVSPSDLVDFDAESVLSDHGVDGDISNAEFEVTDSPTGFDTVAYAIDRDTAIAVYAALDSAGYTVS